MEDPRGWGLLSFHIEHPFNKMIRIDSNVSTSIDMKRNRTSSHTGLKSSMFHVLTIGNVGLLYFGQPHSRPASPTNTNEHYLASATNETAMSAVDSQLNLNSTASFEVVATDGGNLYCKSNVTVRIVEDSGFAPICPTGSTHDPLRLTVSEDVPGKDRVGS